ncbi:MAG: hypothetical protein EPN26_04770 [Rhodospirillales bacterium]|nr:MAG: hypothetical protein EPN26_04770 [Rhodospirillales bacterium]
MQFQITHSENGQRRTVTATYASAEAARHHFQELGLLVEDIVEVPQTLQSAVPVASDVAVSPRTAEKIQPLTVATVAGRVTLTLVVTVGIVLFGTMFIPFNPSRGSSQYAFPILAAIIAAMPPIWRGGFSLKKKMLGFLSAEVVAICVGVIIPDGLISVAIYSHPPMHMLEMVGDSIAVSSILIAPIFGVLVMNRLRGSVVRPSSWDAAAKVAARPPTVDKCVKAFWGLGVLVVLHILLGWDNMIAEKMAQFDAWIIILILAITFGIVAFLFYKIAQGANWARIVYLVMFVLGLWTGVPMLFSEIVRSPLGGLISIAQWVLTIYTLYLLFTEPAKSWFRRNYPVSTAAETCAESL